MVLCGIGVMMSCHSESSGHTHVICGVVAVTSLACVWSGNKIIVRLCVSQQEF